MHRWMIGSGQPRGRGSGGAGFISRYWCQPAVSRAAVIRGYSRQNSIFRDPRLRVVRIHLKIIQAISKLAEVTTEPGPAVMSAYYLVKFWADFAGWVGHKTIRCDVSYWTLISIFKNLEPKALFIHNYFCAEWVKSSTPVPADDEVSGCWLSGLGELLCFCSDSWFICRARVRVYLTPVNTHGSQSSAAIK